ncbi:hypothetical protein WG901_19705 [Novosphingobium sp. PS1R-30]|uniref:Uncharacterized protein n=1 Tax=Novosphingobium anseongense TaxID=3133436 RepID=A0ABU8S1R5_9SPHN
MKLMRWAMAGATVYVIYRYSIGRKGPGAKVFTSQDDVPQTAEPPLRKRR